MIEHDAKALLAAVATGDKHAMQSLYKSLYPGLIQFVEGRLKDRAEAADVAHETFLAVWQQAGRFEGRSSVRTWVYSIARNKTLERLRRLGREEALDDTFDAPDLSVDIAAAAEASSDARRVRSCIAKLSEAHRRVIHLAFYDEMNYGDIADLEGVPTGTIKTRIFHAKRLLLHCLGRNVATA